MTPISFSETTNCTPSEEFKHIEDWAIANKMVINMSKTKELVFCKSHPSRSYVPLAVNNIGQVKIAKLFGVIFLVT